MDYSALERCLIQQDWHAADRETDRLMTAIRDRTHHQIQTQLQAELSPANCVEPSQQQRWQRQHHLEIAHFPLTDWQKVDHLWVNHSGGRFGFTVQLRIWLELGALLG